MTALRSRNGALLFKLEASEGVPETPDAGTDAVLIENPSIRFNPQNTETRELTGSLDNRGPIVGGMQVQVSFDVYLKGSGTADVPPEWGDVLKACAWGQVITAPAVPVAAEACGAGGSTTMAVLGASAAATAQLYRGMPIVFTGAVEGTSFIADYTAGKEATLTDEMSGAIGADTSYQIPSNVLYRPISSAIPTGTLLLYMDGVLYTLAGARGTWTLACPAAGPGKLSFTLSAMFISKTDAEVPACTYDATRPPIFKGGRMLINRSRAAMSNLSLDNGNQVVFPENPNASEGFDPSIITERSLTGSVDPQATLVATRNILAAMRAGTEQIVHARWGDADGNRVGITIPAALYTANDPGDRQALMTEQTSFSCVGQDAGAMICLWGGLASGEAFVESSYSGEVEVTSITGMVVDTMATGATKVRMEVTAVTGTPGPLYIGWGANELDAVAAVDATGGSEVGTLLDSAPTLGDIYLVDIDVVALDGGKLAAGFSNYELGVTELTLEIAQGV